MGLHLAWPALWSLVAKHTGCPPCFSHPVWFPLLQVIVNFDSPRTLETYLHRYTGWMNGTGGLHTVRLGDVFIVQSHALACWHWRVELV